MRVLNPQSETEAGVTREEAATHFLISPHLCVAFPDSVASPSRAEGREEGSVSIHSSRGHTQGNCCLWQRKGREQ